jgi:hypothetical protein
LVELASVVEFREALATTDQTLASKSLYAVSTRRSRPYDFLPRGDEVGILENPEPQLPREVDEAWTAERAGRRYHCWFGGGGEGAGLKNSGLGELLEDGLAGAAKPHVAVF